MNISFSRNLIKGRIAEVIFEQMIRDEGEYTVIPFGYEHTVPTLAQYRHLSEVKEVMDNISDAPDFALVSEDKTKLYLVEVKYQKTLNNEEVLRHADKLLKRWESPWIFIATKTGFFCSPCNSIRHKGRITELAYSWVAPDRQAAYLELLNEFES